MSTLTTLKQELLTIRLNLQGKTTNRFERYQKDPAGYIRDVLKVELWQAQQDICRFLLEPPHRVLCRACHSVGKTFIAGCLTNWFFDSFPDGTCITTAPTARDVRDVLWREVRMLRRRAGLGGFTGHRMPELYDNEDHYAKGFTANSGESFQGRHSNRMFFIFDEGVGVDAIFWTTLGTMFKPDGNHFALAIGNPTDTSSQMYQEDQAVDEHGNPKWHPYEMSALDHPNIAAELESREPPFPSAVSLSQFRDWINDWCEPVGFEERMEADFEFPVGSGNWWRPGPEMEARGLGRWPSSGTYGVWSNALWKMAFPSPALKLPGLTTMPEIGCDVARFGTDDTAIHVRCGSVSLHHERHNGWDTSRTTGRLKELCVEYAEWSTLRRPPQAEPIDPKTIRVKVDDGGVGCGVTDHRDGYRFISVIAQSTARNPDKYPESRSELWFSTAKRAKMGMLDLTRLDKKTIGRLRQQVMAPLWKQDAAGRRKVESKDDTKKRLGGGSPDDADALNLAYYEYGDFEVAQRVETEQQRDSRGIRFGGRK